MKGGLHHLLVLLDSPLVTFEYATVFALEHLGCIFAAFQLPIKPSDGGKTDRVHTAQSDVAAGKRNAPP